MFFLYWYELKTRTSTILSNCNPLGLAEVIFLFVYPVGISSKTNPVKPNFLYKE